ncbi:putative sugar-bisphosphate aldolase [Escherichia coli]|uniref:Putative sugar-bisphosphate aldolase n=1 Tax=Escherichia coli TaxID=562 RepID=A0A377CG62_ECOLX|nr:putative sugar-bisphosphate aldolase [Escherichia coli]
MLPRLIRRKYSFNQELSISSIAGIPVEAELGHVGNETVYEEALAGYHYTDPDQAAEFVERTGCDSLAVAIGNQHGVYTSEPQLNFEVVKRVRDAVSVPLVLHGASGSVMPTLKLQFRWVSQKSTFIRSSVRPQWSQ